MDKIKEIFGTIVEYLLFGFALFIIFQHTQVILNYKDGVLAGIVMEITTYPIVYIAFIIVFIIWAFMKWKNIEADKKERQEIIKLLKEIKNKK